MKPNLIPEYLWTWFEKKCGINNNAYFLRQRIESMEAILKYRQTRINELEREVERLKNKYYPWRNGTE